MDFKEFPKLSRWSREIVITEKIDGTNASIFIGPNGEFLTGSRTRWITPQDDNYGFSAWAHEHTSELMKLGPGHHFGEWWGKGIQRNYGLQEKRFYLFNTSRWSGVETRPTCCGVVPILFTGQLESQLIYGVLDNLAAEGSRVAPGFMKPEGIVIYHTAANISFKKTIEKDETPKSKQIKET